MQISRQPISSVAQLGMRPHLLDKTREPANRRVLGIVPNLAHPLVVVAAAPTASVTEASRAAVRRAVAAPSAVEVLAEPAPEPPVPGDPRAWVPAEAGEEAAADPEAVAGGAGSQIEDKHMKSNTFCIVTSKALLAVALATSVQAAPQSKTPSVAATPQRSFASPQLAADALFKAGADYDVPALVDILGPDSGDLVASADPVRDKTNAAEAAAKAREKHVVIMDPKNSKRATITIGNDDFPLPIPIVERNGRWYFDTKAGRQEILFRRIGENELDAIALCRGFVEAQKEYAQTIHDNSGVNQYAQKIVSTPGKQDGLAWRNPDGSWAGPVGETVANALEEGYVDKRMPFHGYYFKVLKGQGSGAFLGKIDYVIGGAMIGGFAFVAVPAEYRVTGVKTFMISYDGIVYEKDLGPDSLNIVKSMDLYNPDKTWGVTDDEP